MTPEMQSIIMLTAWCVFLHFTTGSLWKRITRLEKHLSGKSDDYEAYSHFKDKYQ